MPTLSLPRVLALACALSAAAAPLAAQTLARSDTGRPAAGRRDGGTSRVVRAAPAVAIHIDGKLDEAAWAQAAPAADFVQQRPNVGEAGTERTEARVLFDADAIYVAMRMYDAHPDSILAQLTRRDAESTSDGARVFIDSYNDKRTAFAFGLNPKGVKNDFLRFDDGGGVDFGWDAVWDGAARVDSAGWVAEFRIPLSQLRFNESTVNGGGRWGINFRREIARKAETVFWSPIPPNSSGFVSLFGELEGVSGVRQGRRLEILPYTSARVTHVPGTDADPFWSPNEAVGSIGADLKAGLPGGLTLSATINPDFGQVEVDPTVVNLGPFETFFPERRPFFVEGADIFDFARLNSFNLWNTNTFFYSRRVGRAPQGFVDVDDAEWSESPEATTILGAAKVSGKTGPWSIGVMDALTQRETAPFVTGTGGRGDYAVEPLTNYFVGRVRRDLRQGQTVVGAMATGVTRDLRGNEFDAFLRGSAYVAGVDALHTWKDREWALSGYFAASTVRGSADAIARTQRSSARYFQRPDADYLDYDDTRETLDGRVVGAAVSHTGKWDGSLAYQEVSPGFETNDIGFQGRADSRAFSTFLGRRVNKPGRVFRDFSQYGYTWHAFNFGGDLISSGYAVGSDFTFKNLWYGGGGVTFNPEVVNDRLTRGGPLALVPRQWSVNAYLGTDSRKKVSLQVNGSYREDASGEYDRGFGVTANLRPTSSVQVSVGPSFSRERDTDQFVGSVAYSGAAATFGREYLLANVDQTTLAMDTRLDWTFSPNLSLTVFAQPFVAAGDFWNYKVLENARSFDFRAIDGPDGSEPFSYDPDGAGPAGALRVERRPDQLDFKLVSLRANAVLRWEYRPGSTVFLVWQQNRGSVLDDGNFRLGSDVGDIFEQRSGNVFLIKATYWLNR